jgi:hypothetical protein
MAGNYIHVAFARFLPVIRVERAIAGDDSQTSSLQNSNRFPSGS